MNTSSHIAPPLFDRDALCAWLGIVGAADPLVRRGLPQVHPPAFDSAQLLTTLAIIGDSTATIGRGLGIVPPGWRDGAEAVGALFGLGPDHCFRVAPHRWARFHEPQITRGFAHFVTSGSPAQRLARAVALIGAAASSGGFALDLDGATAATCLAEENRTDLLVEVTVAGRRVGASIEAKFQHKLTPGQLRKALDTIRGRPGNDKAAPARYARLVVAPDDPSGTLTLRHNRQWRGAAWSTLLLHLERLTDPAHDCLDYRRFRRTVWRRAY